MLIAYIKVKHYGAGEMMTQQLKVTVTLAERLSLVPNTHMVLVTMRNCTLP